MVMKFIAGISGKGQRQKSDDAISEAETGTKPAAPVAPAAARISPAKKSVGRPAKAKSGLRGLYP